jgi:hypothetical protein
VKQRGDELIEHICRGGSDDDANELLAELYRGFPISNVRRLLRCDQEQVVRVAVWITSELGEAAAPLMPDIALLLRHQLPFARFFALDAVLAAASPAQGDIIAEAIRLINDDEEAVRWKAMQFLARATRQQLSAGLRHANDISIARLLKWLRDVGSEDVGEIIAAVDDVDACKRRFAAAAAARILGANRLAIEHAASAEDPEVRSFAQETAKNSD